MRPDLPFRAVVALGATQIVGYGTLYYAFALLAPAMAAELAWPEARVFGALAVALLLGGLTAPWAGRLVDRLGAIRVMSLGSVLSAGALVFWALTPGPVAFVLGLIIVEVAAGLVLYNAAFAAIVQFGGQGAQRRIVHLTLIAGFASTVFWPLTAAMAEQLDWRTIYLVFAAAHVLICLPLHLTLPRPLGLQADGVNGTPKAAQTGLEMTDALRRQITTLLLVGTALLGFVFGSVTVHMVPLLQTLGLGTVGPLIAALFGPAQVASRLVNMIVGQNLAQVHLAVIAVSLPVAGVAVLAFSASVPGAMVFAVLFGMGSGLVSIVMGTLPLELFGSSRYGHSLGRFTAARQLMGAVAPYLFALMLGGLGTGLSLWMTVGIGFACITCFALISKLARPALRL